MDKYNIIEPTDDLAQLNSDMSNWYNMNFNMRMRANDSCISMYGCTVPQLYNRIKNKIIKVEDRSKEDKDNIIFEDNYIIRSDEKKQYEDYDNKILMSKLWQNSPYVIILDPDISNKEELDIKFNSFNSLSEKDRRISNDYSWQLWGFNVYDMYNKLNRQFIELPDNFFDSNITKSSEIDKYTESLIDENFINHNRLYDFDPVLEANTYYGELESIKESRSKKQVLLDRYKPIKESYKFPKYIPNLSESDILINNITIHIDNNYASSLMEAYNNKDNEKLLSLGWNPYIPVNEESLYEAHINAANHIVDIWDLTKVYTEEFEPINDNNLPKAVYIIRSMNDKSILDISFDERLDNLYHFNGIGSTFRGFNKSSKLNYILQDPKYYHIEIIAIFVDEDVYNRLLDVCNNLLQNTNILPGFETVFGFITDNYKNRFDPDLNKIMLTQYIDIITKLANFDIETNTFSNNYARINNALAYRIYIGKLDDYNPDRTVELINILFNNNNINKFASENSMNESAKEFIIKAITPSIIVQSLI